MIKSPYNFVPAPKENEVFTPGWAAHVLHDMPLSEEAESGEIEFTIQAETPIFIRNGHSKEDHEVFEKWRDHHNCDETKLSPSEKEKLDRYLAFSNYNGQYFIPATSIKGMLRNVMEIMSFAKLDPKLVNDDRYSHRDLTDGSLYRDIYDTNKINCGWLKIEKDGNWIIEDCGKPLRISYDEIDNEFSTNFSVLLTPEIYDNISDYKELNGKHYFKFKNKEFSLDKKKYSINRNQTKVVKKLLPALKNAKGKYDILLSRTKILFNGIRKDGVEYTLIMTGSPSYEKQKEFLFSSNVLREIPLAKDEKISEKKKKDFLFTYKDHDKNNISADWKFWKSKLNSNNGKIPLFFTEENGEIKHFGLSYMYKLPYKNSIHETKTFQKGETELNIVRCIFGDTGVVNLKGRVFISHAKCMSSTELGLKKEILASPKASYLPFYIKQKEGKNGDYKYLSYEDEVEISGYKRYPVHSSKKEFNREFQGNYDNRQLENAKVFSFFKPLNKNSQFNCKIRYNNLHPVEVGALLSSITFHGTSNSCYHSIGSSKPFGYGKVSVKLNSIRNQFGLSLDLNSLLLKFENYMENRIENWLDSERMRSLFTYSQGLSQIELSYMKLEEFVDLKNQWVKQYLQPENNTMGVISIKKKLEPQELLNISEFQDFDKLSIFLNSKFMEVSEFSDQNKDIICEKIKSVFESGHKPSIKKLTSDYPWKNNIPKWLGSELAKILFNDLSKNQDKH
ncbi:MAG TPA: TIGR03986 family CRISPR-associated RAMP protein [Saprospiraceae bacterium]|nr:TIGR03986 family CRISPR-associated RAMP protein [Saprospiraceae bacterium]